MLRVIVFATDAEIGRVLTSWLVKAEIHSTCFSSYYAEAIIAHVRATATMAGGIDAVVFMVDWGYDVFTLRQLRTIDPDSATSNGLRIRSLPLLAVTYSDVFHEAIREIDGEISLFKLAEDGFEVEFLKALGKLMADYRHRLLEEFQHVGIGIAWEHGKFQLVGVKEALLESKYLVGSQASACRTYHRLILFADRARMAELAVEEFRMIVNSPRCSERCIQDFFERHPEFILDDSFDSYWAEPSIENSRTGEIVRPDFVVRPMGASPLPWAWKIIDLKRPGAPLLVNEGIRASLSMHVHKLIDQLRRYHDFFTDRINHEAITKRFGGVPFPRLVGIIGRLPRRSPERYAVLLSREAGVTITTYDEVLMFRESKVQRLKSLEP